MPEVTMNNLDAKPAGGEQASAETPTQQIVRAASAERMVEVKNPAPVPDGQMPVVTLHYRTMRALERMDLNSIAGAQNAMNMAWMADASIAYAITRINGEPVRKPATLLELRAQIQRIGDEGMDALAADAMRIQAEDGDGPGDGLARAKN